MLTTHPSLFFVCFFVCLFALFACFFHHINIHYSSSSTSRLMGLLELEAVLEEASEVEEGAYTLLCRNLNDVLDGSTFRFSFCFSFPLSADMVASMVGIISPLSLDI